MELYYLRRIIRRNRERLGLSQMDLSLMAGLNKNVVGYVESGKHTPTLPTILKILDAMELDIKVIKKDG